MRKLLAEAIGTFWLVLGGCGTAIFSAAFPQVGVGLLGVAFAFGLTVLTMAYAIGPISGCHLNPAVTVGLAAGGRFPKADIVPYIVAQVIGAIVAAAVLYFIARGAPGFDAANGFAGQAWYYDFINFAHMGYLEGGYTFKTGSGFDPFVKAQYLDESGGAGTTLVVNQAPLFGVPGSRVKSSAWGGDVGVNIPHGSFDVAYNKIGTHNGAVGDGAIISPYTAAYATDPLYTTSMIRGLVEQGPGHAWKGKFTYKLLNDQLLLMVAYAKYTTQLRGSSHDAYLDITYNFDGKLKGLSLRDRWERANGGLGLNPGNGSFTYNRVMITYKF